MQSISHACESYRAAHTEKLLLSGTFMYKRSWVPILGTAVQHNYSVFCVEDTISYIMARFSTLPQTLSAVSTLALCWTKSCIYFASLRSIQ